MDKIDLKLDSTHHVSVAKEARAAMKRLRRLEEAYKDREYRKRSWTQAQEAGRNYFLLRGIAKIFDDPRGWLDPAKRKDDPCFQGFSQEQIASLSHWAETAWNEKHRKEMADGCREWAEKCNAASHMLLDQLQAFGELDGKRPRPLAHLVTCPLFPEHYRLNGINPDGTVRLVREREKSRTGFYLLRNYLRAGRYDTIHPHVRAALWAVHSVEDFLLGVVGRTEAVLSGKAVAAHHARVLHLDQKLRGSLSGEDLKSQSERIGQMLKRSNPANYFVRIQQNGIPLPSAGNWFQNRTIPPASTLAKRSARMDGPKRLPEATVIDIGPEI
ncbi:MAG: hypothetical protein PHP75_07175 [Methylacidiphilaceae bacterium]|nr:hypothetical protein [Candidatus Methylacidiphilaceae bacterium]